MAKHPDCDPCSCGAGDVHCKHAHQPWFELTDDETAVLDFEAQQWTHPGAKETAIVQEFGILAPAYYAKLNWLIDQPEALAHSPLLVRRLRRLREARQAARASRRPEVLPMRD